MSDEYESPILLHLVDGVKVEVEDKITNEILAHCRIGDDDDVERIADILSMKRLHREAAALRKMMMDARKSAGRGVW